MADRDENEAFLAAQPGHAYAVFFPAATPAGSVTLNLAGAPNDLVLRWIDIDSGDVRPDQPVRGGGPWALSPPGHGNFAAVLTRAPAPAPNASP